MLLSDIQKTIWSWVFGQLNLLLDGEQIIWSNPNAPRPNFPYVMLQFISMVRMGGDSFSKPDDDGIRKIIANNYLNLNISCYYATDGSLIDAINILDTLRLSLRKEVVVQLLNDNFISVTKEVSSIANLPALIATGFEQRATMDVQFGVATSIDDDVGLIEKLGIKGILHNQTQDEIDIDINVGE